MDAPVIYRAPISVVQIMPPNRSLRALLERYRERLSEHGIDYPAVELQCDYRLTTALCFIYPLLATGRIEVANERQVELLRAMTNGAAAAIEDHDALALRPD